MSAKLVERADAVRTKAKVLESVKGSGYHDDDRNVVRPDLFAAPQRNGLPRLSEHVVYFTDRFDEWVLFAGSDAERVAAALNAWAKRAEKLDPATLTGTERKLVTRIVPSLFGGATAGGLANDDGVPVLRVRRDYWNDVLHALYAEGLGVSGLPLEE